MRREKNKLKFSCSAPQHSLATSVLTAVQTIARQIKTIYAILAIASTLKHYITCQHLITSEL